MLCVEEKRKAAWPAHNDTHVDINSKWKGGERKWWEKKEWAKWKDTLAHSHIKMQEGKPQILE